MWKRSGQKKAVGLTIQGKRHYFHLHHVRKISQRGITKVVLSKAFAELVAIGTGVGGVFYTISAFADRALFMDTLSVMAAIAALFVGIEHLRYLKEHDLMRRAVIFVGVGVLLMVALLVLLNKRFIYFANVVEKSVLFVLRLYGHSLINK